MSGEETSPEQKSANLLYDLAEEIRLHPKTSVAKKGRTIADKAAEVAALAIASRTQEYKDVQKDLDKASKDLTGKIAEIQKATDAVKAITAVVGLVDELLSLAAGAAGVVG